MITQARAAVGVSQCTCTNSVGAADSSAAKSTGVASKQDFEFHGTSMYSMTNLLAPARHGNGSKAESAEQTATPTAASAAGASEVVQQQHGLSDTEPARARSFPFVEGEWPTVVYVPGKNCCTGACCSGYIDGSPTNLQWIDGSEIKIKLYVGF